MKRQRATIIVEGQRGILLVESHAGLVLLPGGGINPKESLLQAAARELAEETGLIAESLLFLFSHDSATNCHHVFWAAAPGEPLAADDAKAVRYFDADNEALTGAMSRASRQIIDRFLALGGEAGSGLAAQLPGAAEALVGAYI
jgi:8-oxo-dGTP diphosphatase